MAPLYHILVVSEVLVPYWPHANAARTGYAGDKEVHVGCPQKLLWLYNFLISNSQAVCKDPAFITRKALIGCLHSA